MTYTLNLPLVLLARGQWRLFRDSKWEEEKRIGWNVVIKKETRVPFVWRQVGARFPFGVQIARRPLAPVGFSHVSATRCVAARRVARFMLPCNPMSSVAASTFNLFRFFISLVRGWITCGKNAAHPSRSTFKAYFFCRRNYSSVEVKWWNEDDLAMRGTRIC